MTYVIGVRCDICGELRIEQYHGQEHKLPDGWADITVHYTHIEVGPSNQAREICEQCARALESGESVEIYKARRQAQIINRGIPVPCSNQEPEVIPLADKEGEE
jgi:hypothetical protein